MLLAGTRLVYVMAKDGLFFKNMATLGKKSQVPEVAIIYQGIWSMILVLSGSYSNLLDYMVVASVIFYALTVSGLFRIPKLYPELVEKVKWRAYPVVPIIFCVMCVLILSSLLIYRPFYALMSVLIVLTGIPVYFFWRKINPIEASVDDSSIEPPSGAPACSA
jgi:basic amino acid/polyamine antiporter, APA family